MALKATGMIEMKIACIGTMDVAWPLAIPAPWLRGIQAGISSYLGTVTEPRSFARWTVGLVCVTRKVKRSREKIGVESVTTMVCEEATFSASVLVSCGALGL
jgi:hypothetical protein